MSIANYLFYIFPLVMLTAAFSDIISYRIPNILSLVLLAAFFPFAFYSGMAWGQAGIHVLVGFGVLAVTFGLFSFGLFGGGDAKLLATASLWVGYPDVGIFLIFVTLAGGAVAIALIIFRRLPIGQLESIGWIGNLHRSKTDRRDVPYAVAIALGTFWVMPKIEIAQGFWPA